MNKIPSSKSFFKVDKIYIQKLKIGWEAAGLLAYIAEFEAQGKPCFVSRKRMATETTISETTIHRLLKLLVDKLLITVHRQGRKRIVKLSKKGVQIEHIQKPERVQIEQDEVFKMNFESVQIEHIQRNIYKEKLYKESNLSNVIVDKLDRKNLTKEKPTMPEPEFNNFWDNLSEESKTEFAAKAASQLPLLKAKLATGPDGLAKLIVLQEFWKGIKTVVEEDEF